MAASLFDHPGFLLLIAAVALVRWLIQNARGKTQNTKTPTPPPPPPTQPIARGGNVQTEEERVRRFLEALGQPRGPVPPKVAPRPRPVQPRIFPNLPPLTTVPPPLPEPEVFTAPAPPPLPMEERGVPSMTRSETGFEVHDVVRQISSEPAAAIRGPATTQGGFKFKLDSSVDLRTAIVLREVFGPPRGLQPLDAVIGS